MIAIVSSRVCVGIESISTYEVIGAGLDEKAEERTTASWTGALSFALCTCASFCSTVEAVAEAGVALLGLRGKDGAGIGLCDVVDNFLASVVAPTRLLGERRALLRGFFFSVKSSGQFKLGSPKVILGEGVAGASRCELDRLRLGDEGGAGASSPLE